MALKLLSIASSERVRLYIDKLDAEIRVSRTAQLCVWNHIQVNFTVEATI
jgi:hypothetical protein